jgi:two-component system sensor histidine kinase PilS (NtrC family)
MREGQWPEAGRDLSLDFADPVRRTLRVRARFTSSGPPIDGREQAGRYCMLLLEDVRTAQARLRQERLAAMGRVSTGIAHEIRNPLAAIVQANALLLETGLASPQERLSRMVADNARRLQRVVDDVLQAAVPSATEPPRTDAAAEVRAIVADWMQAAGEAADAGRVQADLPEPELPVLFDAEHLRRVIVNLLDNASRHASADPGAITLRLTPRDERSALLAVANDGEPMPADVERRLFEPFFSTRSRGSGLGLYICRELCERHGATIEYRSRPATQRHRNSFLVVMQRPALAVPEPPGLPSP